MTHVSSTLETRPKGLVDITWTVVQQAAQGLRDAELIDVVTRCEGETIVQLH